MAAEYPVESVRIRPTFRDGYKRRSVLEPITL